MADIVVCVWGGDWSSILCICGNDGTLQSGHCLSRPDLHSSRCRRKWSIWCNFYYLLWVLLIA